MNEEVRCSHIPIVLDDLILQNQMAAESVPRQLRDQPVILMEILTVVREDQIRRNRRFQALEVLLYLCSDVGKEAISELIEHYVLAPRSGQKATRTLSRFSCSESLCCKYNPIYFRTGMLLQQP